MSEVIELYTPEGEVVAYRPLAARLPAFLAAFGPETGYSVETDFSDLLSLQPGVRSLYEAAIREGRKAEDCGLPPVAQTARTLVCRAVLKDLQGRAVATATAAKPIQDYKDVEMLETAARQRLLAALGYGGDVLTRDERLDWAARGLDPDGPEAAPDDPVPIVPETTGAIPGGADAPAPARSGPPVALDPPPAKASDRRARPSPASQNERLLDGLLQQIAQHAARQGIPPPTATTVEQAREILKRLIRPAARTG